ncbi:flagellar filament capping protein FliD [Arthrobacter bambusae]|uniref:flagellar filament capping protein FliD n=1 Tax=Arthrobacter bambusae TaxID=1338426 RepID=UPI002783C558|nr:flagellar filament capping protein FliD [Arthrobacter bambusae]MDQ0029423.1 flagellar hook-associated protein 2 [Arthrobacter bambusae]MDQ0097083.1 flagellar hook-associated protein 2 [Arthrobacter bambusae]
MGASIDGLASGLNTTSMIDAQMAVEALPQQQLQSKVATDQSMINALNSLNTRLTVLNSLATSTSAPGATNLFTATTNSQGVTATASTSASAGSIDITVTQLSSTKIGVTQAFTAWPTDASGNPAHLTLVDKTGKATEITPASTSLDDVVKAVNAAGGGATAVKVPAGNGTYRLQLTSSTSGAAGDFQAYQGTAADVAAGTATDLFAAPTAAIVKPAADAQAVLYAGTAAQQTITSSTNTFSDVLPGIAVTATAVSSSPVTVTVASDTAGISKKAGDLVSSVNDLLGYIATSSAVNTTTSSAGVASAQGGIFTGNSSVRAVSDALTEAVVAPVNGKSPSDYGIAIQRDGTFTFDSGKFASAMAADPAGTQSALSQIATRVATATTNASDPVNGSIPQLIKGQQSEVSTLNSQIAEWDTRLADRRAALKTVYTNMEVLLGNLKSQSSWLSGQISSLSSSSSSSSGK